MEELHSIGYTTGQYVGNGQGEEESGEIPDDYDGDSEDDNDEVQLLLLDIGRNDGCDIPMQSHIDTDVLQKDSAETDLLFKGRCKFK